MKKILALSALGLVCTTLNAQVTDSIPEVTKNLKEITVTSLYRNKIITGSLIDSKTLISEDHGQGADYVLSKLPSLYAYNDNGTHMGYCYFRIRGMGQERMNITLDGMPWNEAEDFGCYFSNSPGLMSSMHSIKVEKGAGVTNNGTASFAGNISLESADLKKDTLSYADIGGGSFSSFRTNAVYNMGLKGHWGLHVRATHQQTDGYKENCYNNSQALTVKVGYFFNSKHSIDLLTMTGYHRNGQGFMGLPEEMIPTSLNPFKQQPSGNRQQETDDFLTTYNRLQYNGVLSDKLFLTSTVYWQHQTGNYRIGWDDSPYSHVWIDYFNGGKKYTTNQVLWNYHLNYNMIGGNVVAKYYARENLSITGGVNSYVYHRRHQGYNIKPDTIISAWTNPGIAPEYDNAGTKPDVNIFATVKYSPVEKLNLEGNIQYRHTSLAYRVNRAYIFNEGDLDFDHSWDFVNYGFGADYELTRESKVYTKFSVANREPSRTDLFGAEYRSIDSEMNTDPERVYDLELGYELRKSWVNLCVSGFYMNLKDELVATGELSSQNFLPLHEQHDGYRYGLEVSSDFKPTRGLDIIFNASWQGDKIKGYQRHTFTPAQTYYGEISYTTTRGFKYGLTAQYRSKLWMDLNNDFALKDLFTLGAYLKCPINKHLDFELNMDNLTNRVNMSNGSVSGGTAYYLIDSPFNFFANLKIKL